MYGLEVPLEFSGHCVECYHRVAKEVVTFPVKTVVVTRGAAEYCVENASFTVDRHVEAPVVCASAIFPSIGRPGFIADFTCLRHGMKFPNLRSRARIICAGVPGLSGCRLLRHIRADEQ